MYILRWLVNDLFIAIANDSYSKYETWEKNAIDFTDTKKMIMIIFMN